MAAVVSQNERRVAVRLSQIPMRLRQEFADKLRARDGLTQYDALLEWGLAVAAIRQDPVLLVPEWKADLVLKQGKAPPGETPRF